MLAPAQRFWRFFELAFLFFVFPLLVFAFDLRSIMFALLWGIVVYAALIWCGQERCFSKLWQKIKDEWRGAGLNADMRKEMLLRFALSAVGLLLLTLWLVPERLFAFPLERPGLWLMVMLLYPLLSALPQEFLYRSFFVKRYELLFPNYNMLAITTAISFGLAHLLFQNPVAPLLSAVGSWFFSQSYQRHQSLFWATVEHAAYGCLVFTLGLGWFFYHGAVRGG